MNNTGHKQVLISICHLCPSRMSDFLCGREGYEHVRQADEQRIVPTAKDIKSVIEGATPALILIDELADYCAKASGLVVGGGTLFTQTNSFIQTLTEVVASIPRTVLICTLPASATASCSPASSIR